MDTKVANKGLMYEDPVRWGLTFQSYVQLTMMNFHIIPSPHPLKILERSLFSARYCFVENLARQVYLHTKPEVVLERIKVRERKEECSVSLEYLQQLHKLHEEWLCNTETPVIVVDANPGIDEMQGEFSRYKSLILEKAASHLTKENKSIEKLPQSERPKILEGEPEVSAAQ
ncbi:Deoxynucleoside kinase [Blattella germanica]|nr:Deoxynucleoside kinase [Blattella germanica]